MDEHPRNQQNFESGLDSFPRLIHDLRTREKYDLPEMAEQLGYPRSYAGWIKRAEESAWPGNTGLLHACIRRFNLDPFKAGECYLRSQLQTLWSRTYAGLRSRGFPIQDSVPSGLLRKM